jgi:hypothetical protein
VSFRASSVRGKPLLASLAARGTDPHGSIFSWLWFFGDGRRGRGASVVHRYRLAGSYRVVLRASDSWRNWAFYAVTLSVTARGRVAVTKSG